MITASGTNLVFIISQPRSGSTLLQRILAMSPLVSTVSEPWVALKIVKSYIDNVPLKDEPWNGELAEDALDDFASKEAVRDAVRAFLVSLYNHRLNGPIFIDKTPRYYEIIPELSALFPQAKIILLFRNPLAVLGSILQTWAKDGDLTGFSRDLYEAPKLMIAGRSCPNTYCIKYEEMVTDVDVVRNLFKHLNIPFKDSYLNYGTKPGFDGSMGDKNVDAHSAPDPSRARGFLETFKNPANMTAAKEYLSKLDADLLESLGYPKEQLEAALKLAQP